MTPKRWLATVGLTAFVVCIVLFAGLLFSIEIVRQPGYPAAVADPAIALQDTPFLAHGESCDILVDGDSTAATGIDPTVIAERTGLSACNIATSRPIVDDLGTWPLDTFLDHNPKPRVLVFQLGPEDFYQSNRPWEHVGPYSPLAMIARDMPRRRALAIMLRHPAESVQFVFYVLKDHASKPAGDNPAAAERYRRTMAHAAATHGQLDLELPAQTVCKTSVEPLDGPLDAERIRALRRKYERQGIEVLIRAAPLPSCDPQLARFQSELAPVVDGNVESLPIGLFTAGDRHPTQAGSRIVTLGLVDWIEAHRSKPRDTSNRP